MQEADTKRMGDPADQSALMYRRPSVLSKSPCLPRDKMGDFTLGGRFDFCHKTAFSETLYMR